MESGHENVLQVEALVFALGVIGVVACVALLWRLMERRRRRELQALRIECAFLRDTIDRAERILGNGAGIPRGRDTAGERQHRALEVLINAQSMRVTSS